MKNNPKISIILVSFNQGKFIEFAIKSFLNQNYQYKELLIIDGGSNDNTLEIIKNYQHSLSYFVSEKDKGMYHARNKGILKADGDIIGFLNCDDLLNKDALQIIANSFTETPDFDMIFGITGAININNEISEKLKWGAFNFNNKKYFNRMLTLPDQSTFFNARVFSIIGLYNTDYKFGADTEIKCRVIKKNLNIKQIPDTIAFWRLYEDTLTHRPDLKWERLFEAIKINRIYNRTYFTKYNIRLVFNYLFFDELKKYIKKVLKK